MRAQSHAPVPTARAQKKRDWAQGSHDPRRSGPAKTRSPSSSASTPLFHDLGSDEDQQLAAYALLAALLEEPAEDRDVAEERDLRDRVADRVGDQTADDGGLPVAH